MKLLKKVIKRRKNSRMKGGDNADETQREEKYKNMECMRTRKDEEGNVEESD